MSAAEVETLRTIIKELRSEKELTRERAVKDIRTHCSTPAAVAKLSSDGRGKPWLGILAGLGEAYDLQRERCVRKLEPLHESIHDIKTTTATSIAVKRLSEIADTIRFIVGQGREGMRQTTIVTQVLVILTDKLTYRGKLVSLTAPQYAQAIALLLAWKPHLQALPVPKWRSCLAIAFNIVLGRRPKYTLEQDIDVDDSDASNTSSDDDASMSVDTDATTGPSGLTSSSSRKRVRPADPAQSDRKVTPTTTFQRPSPEQLEFMTVVAILLSSPSAPILSLDDDGAEDPHAYPRKLLGYFAYFLRVYPAETSLRLDYLAALSAALKHLTINCRLPVAAFAEKCWKPLLSLWKMKDMDRSEDLITVLRLLFPVLTAGPLGEDSTPAPVDALAAFWSTAEATARKRQSPSLRLDSLQLRLPPGVCNTTAEKPFQAGTFENGWKLDREAALAWSVLQLQADCARMLYLHTESTYTANTTGRKRIKLENPIAALLKSIKSHTTAKVHDLQVLLFFADRHWLVLHEQLRRDVVASLTSLISFEDAEVQSWTFLCLAAIAHAEGSSSPDSPPASDSPSLWDPVWTHAIRRANVPAVSRAASHAAHALLLHSKRLLSPQRVLAEIESFAKDLDVQGPAYPYDSVCGFMVLCLRFASQDVRLYRMQMEEKVLSWLTEAWRISGERRTAMPLYTVAHIHSLLEAIVGTSRRVDLWCDIMLPPSPIVDALVDETQSQVIRDFQLHAHLPPYQSASSSSSSAVRAALPPSGQDQTTSLPQPVEANDLVAPRGRERRLSAFLLKSLEATYESMSQPQEGRNRLTAETVRHVLDLAVVTLFFEASLLMNGTQSNRRVIQAACRLLGLVFPMVLEDRWEVQERRLILGALDPLTIADDDDADVWSNVGWEAFVQDTFTTLLGYLRKMLRMTVAQVKEQNPYSAGTSRDDFRPVFHAAASTQASKALAGAIVHHGHVARACITALVNVPILQSSGTSTHDAELTKLFETTTKLENRSKKKDAPVLIDDAACAAFLVIVPPCLDYVRQGRLRLSSSNITNLLERVDELLQNYAFKNIEEAPLLIVRTVEATSQWWCGSFADKEVGAYCRFYARQCIEQVKKPTSWRVRYAIIRFFGHYLALDPKQDSWWKDDDGYAFNPDALPAAVLPTLGNDYDIRIRFRVATTCSRLFDVGRLAARRSLEVYQDIHRNLSANQENFESILTRLLCLANVVISDASVRRGAYWHLLEVAFFSDTYRHHLKAVLMGITTRLGMERFSDLFNCYASQFAYSIRVANIDIYRFPHDLLGYRDRRECAEATFRAFTLTNLLAPGSADEVEVGKELFVRHCQSIQKSEKDGVLECFADLIAHQITLWFEFHSDVENVRAIGGKLEDVLKQKTRMENDPALFSTLFGQERVDDIVVSILRTLGDQDISANGEIVSALRQSDVTDSADIFLAITKYRKDDTFEVHEPNLPRYNAQVVLHALQWFGEHAESAQTRAVTYHVLHNLFSDIEHCPLVNEQYRYLNALCLWISHCHDHFSDITLLRLLVRRSVAIFSQPDLARSAQSLLEWSFSFLKTFTGKPNIRLADVLIRLATIAHGFSEAQDAAPLAQLGVALLDWLEGQAYHLYRNKMTRREVHRALAAWPRELPPSLRPAYDSIQLADLTSALSDQSISSSKFRLVRKMYEVASRDDSSGDQSQFGKAAFWRLKACIPPEDHLVDNDIDAFASLLLLHHGRISSLGVEQFTPDTVYSRHCHVVKQSQKSDKNANRALDGSPLHADVNLARSAIVLSLLAMLDTAAAPQVYTAYATLRALLSTPASDNSLKVPVTSDIDREIEYLSAFRRPRTAVTAPDLPTLLASEEFLHISSDFSLWITRLTTMLCQLLGTRHPFFSSLPLVLGSDHTFADEMLPVLVHSILQIEHNDGKSTIPTSARSTLSQYFSSVLAYELTVTPVCRAIINVVLHLRWFRPSKGTADALAYDKWLSIDFVMLSRCALRCGAYTTALLFLELAREYRPSEPGENDGVPEDVLFEIYNHIDEPDGFYGIQTGDLRNLFVKQLHHEKQWDKAFRYHGAVLEAGGTEDTSGITEALYSFGFNHLALSTMQSFSDTANTLESSSLAYNLGWRAETWDLPERTTDHHPGMALYLAMRAVHRERNPHVVESVIQRAFRREMGRLRQLGDESFTEIRQLIQNLMCLSQVRQWRLADIEKHLRSNGILASTPQSFTTLAPDFEFSDTEAIMATRVSLVHFLRQKEQREQIGDLRSPFHNALVDLEKASLICLSERARGAGEAQLALNSVVRAQKLERTPSTDVLREFANVLWLMKEPKLAIKSLGALVAPHDLVVDDTSLALQRATMLAQLGAWSAEASMKKPSQIVEECFGPAAETILTRHLESVADMELSAASVFHQYAIFAERQYHAITKSPDALRWKLYIDRKKQEIKERASQLSQLKRSSVDPRNPAEYNRLRRQQNEAELLLKQDQEQAQEHLGRRASFLSLAVEMYSHCLSASDAFDDDAPIRLCSLWLANFDNDNATSKMCAALDRVPSRKFVFLAHQLTARLSRTDGVSASPNQAILQRLIQRMCREHPFHSIFPLYCLKIGEGSQLSSSRTSRSSQSPSQDARTAAAADIFDQLRSDGAVSKRIRDVELVCDASLQWAKYPLKSMANPPRPGEKHNIPSHQAIMKLPFNDIKVPVITAHTPIDPTTRYEDCDWIASFKPKYTTAGGVNIPKIVECVGTSTRAYKQLYKGEGDDDLRQDAVMEQVFDLVNVVLRRDRETARRNLSVRAYKVIPLAAKAGILEFVDNTMTLVQWLRPAHPRYRPQDIPYDQFSKGLTGNGKREWKDNPQKVIDQFIELRKRFKPVMRHWFTEKQKSPMPWFTMRLNYSRSVATNSIVGHILGVGDRHTSNILLDTETGEVVHIDLGIAFEQGKLLPQPERVPFRLTADMIDGMGMSGTQGVFQRCAEETLRVLRDGSEIILTVLEVFKYDPLHSWTASEVKIKRAQEDKEASSKSSKSEVRQQETAQLTEEAFRFAVGLDMASGAADEAADRALSAVARKLDKTLSVEYTVNELITEASDPANLALMYVGWSPYY
ncbi:hypothetical protein FKP32DRAFT_1665872 [Trametes sanguinea]|nr:hypothetical protein FKP32DRAFT_1665872 [Trametes sanguinea]